MDLASRAARLLVPTAWAVPLGVCAVVACSSPATPGEPEAVGQARLPMITNAQINGDSLPAKTVVFTYDDGPDAHTIELAQWLHDQGIFVTFFVNGKRLCKSFDSMGNCLVPQDTRACDDGMSQAPVTNPKYYPESVLDQVLALGHHIANHSQDHCHLTNETKAADMLFELKTTQDILDRHICDNVFLYRTPYGEWDDATAGRARATGLDKLVGPINWDVDGEDWNCWQMGTAVDVCGQGYLDILHARPNLNGIFLMHDRPEFNVGYPGALLMTQWLVPKLRADGYKFGTLADVTGLQWTPCTPPVDAGSGAEGGTVDAGGSGSGSGGSTGDAGDSGDDAGGSSSSGSGSGGSSGGGSGGGSSGGGSGGGSSGGGSGGSSGGAGSSGSSGLGASSGMGASSGSGGSVVGGSSGGSGGVAAGSGSGGGATADAPTSTSGGCACAAAPGANDAGDAGARLLAGSVPLVAGAAFTRRRRRTRRAAPQQPGRASR